MSKEKRIALNKALRRHAITSPRGMAVDPGAVKSTKQFAAILDAHGVGVGSDGDAAAKQKALAKEDIKRRVIAVVADMTNGISAEIIAQKIDKGTDQWINLGIPPIAVRGSYKSLTKISAIYKGASISAGDLANNMNMVRDMIALVQTKAGL